MFKIIANADAISNIAPLLDDTEDVVLRTRYGQINAEWFKKHLGHDLVARSEYGDIEERPES